MEWCVVKTGIEMFDALHAYGVGIIAACATNGVVAVQNEGSPYRLSCPCTAVPQVTVDLLDEVFRLPTPQEVLHMEQPLPSHASIPLAVANLDGLLAALFTRSDVVRCCSLSALLHRHRYDPSVIERAIASVRGICTNWKTVTAREMPTASPWLGELLKDYDAVCPCQPLPGVIRRDEGITVAMTLDPSLGYASRQPCSGGRLAWKVNLTVRGARFATLLAYIGAMRFLRAQPVTGGLIAYSVPVAATLTLRPESARPLLWTRDDDEPGQALVLQALDLVTDHSRARGGWKVLSYQVLKAQGKQQAIALSRGAIDLIRFERLGCRPGEHVLGYWQHLLNLPQRERPYEFQHLVDALVTSRREAWEAHLFEVARAVLARTTSKRRNDQGARLRLYSISEVQEVSAVMESPLPTPLSAILERKDGTMRFGHALRQLREQSPSLAHEILEDLESIRTLDQLADALTRAMQVCEVMEAKTPFMITPSDADLKALLEDVERFGAHTIAGLLRLLSTLYYPASEKRLIRQKVRRGAPSSLISMNWRRRRAALKRLLPQDRK